LATTSQLQSAKTKTAQTNKEAERTIGRLGVFIVESIGLIIEIVGPFGVGLVVGATSQHDQHCQQAAQHETTAGNAQQNWK
jgi:hypothetical protein